MLESTVWQLHTENYRAPIVFPTHCWQAESVGFFHRQSPSSKWKGFTSYICYILKITDHLLFSLTHCWQSESVASLGLLHRQFPSSKWTGFSIHVCLAYKGVASAIYKKLQSTIVCLTPCKQAESVASFNLLNRQY